MYYDEVEKMSPDAADDFDMEEIDGQPRYRWYKNALNSTYFIEQTDKRVDIDNIFFYDLEDYFISVDWVFRNDCETLVFIMGERIAPVTEPVKEKFLFHLTKMGYYGACAVVKEHLRSYPVPPERTFNRKKEKVLKDVSEKIARKLYSTSKQLFEFKINDKEKLFDPDKQVAFGVILNINGMDKDYILNSLDSLIWLYNNSREELDNLFNKVMCVEIKDAFIKILSDKELFDLCIYFQIRIAIFNMDFYYDIPPYEPDKLPSIIAPFLDDDEDWD